MPEQSGQTGLTLFLRNASDGALLNAGGDALTESPASSGRFTADVAETWAETLAASVRNASSLTIRDGWLAVGETIVRDSYPSGGGAGDASQETVEEVLDVANSIAVAIAGGSPVEPTGATETVMARLTRIEAATGSILGGRVLRSAGPVTPAGDISLVVGSDYVEDIDGSLLRSFSDPGASVHTKLTAGALSQLVFSAAEKPSDPTTKRIAGTVTEVSEADGVTSVRIEILRTAIPVGPYSADWKYHIWREADDLVSPPLLEGCLTLEWRA
jgi:hypothetical protein